MPVVRISSQYVDGDRRVEPEWSVEDFAKRLESVTGIAPHFQKFEITSATGKVITNYVPSNTLADLGVADGWHFHVVDTRPKEDQLDLTAGDEPKPGMSYEEYEQREGTLLDWKRKNHLGRFGEPRPSSSNPPIVPIQELTVPVGNECFVRLNTGKTVRGMVAFYGPVSVLPPGPWVGVRLLSADGLNDGSVKGVHLFDAEPNHGIVVRANAVRALDVDEEEL